jgi:hypothetical protein
MRVRFLALCAFVAIQACVSAQAVSSVTAVADKARFDKITPLVGTWTCKDTGQSKPYTATAKLDGTWIVWRDTSENASSDYIRWSREMRAYIVTEIYPDGINVSTTTDGDPLNASWNHQFPSKTSITSFSTSFSKDTFTVSVKYVDKSGKSRNGRMVCQKVA